MKRLFVQNIDASDVITDQIPMPSADARAVASLLNGEGKNSVEAWFLGEAGYFNGTMTQTRNAAVARHVGQYNRQAVSGAQLHQIETVAGFQALRSERLRYDFARQGATDWTLAAVVQLGPLAEASNTSLFGWSPGSSGENLPSLNFTGTGVIRSFRYANQQTQVISVAGAVPNIFTLPYLVLISQSRTRGAYCRVNGVTVGSNPFAAGLAPSTGTAVSFLGSDVLSAAFNGYMFETILCNEDVTADTYKLQTVEGYLMRKFDL